jgi:HlyD family secretion protein
MGKGRLLLSAFITILTLAVVGCGAKAAGDPPGQPQAASTTAGQAAAGQSPRGTAAQNPPGTAARRFATISVQAVAIQNAPLVTDNNTAGTVVAVTQSQVAAQIAGVVARTPHKAGDWVKQGEVVVQMDDSALRLAVKTAQVSLENAKINLTMGKQTVDESGPRLADQLKSAQNALTSAQKSYESVKKLFDLGGATSAQLDNAQSALETAQANVEAAKLALDQNSQAGTQTTAELQLAVDQAANQLAITQLNLRNASITAPFAGQIAAVNVTPGSPVSLNTAVYILVSNEKQINFTMPPADAAGFKVGDPLSFIFGGKSYAVKIAQAPSAPIGGVVPMVAALPSSVPAPYGTVGTVTYKLTLAAGSLVPIAALQTRADVNFVYLVQNGKAVEQAVTIIAEAGTTAVLAGVNAGAQVIISPPPGLLAGSSVQVVSLQGQAAAAPGSPGATGSAQQQKASGTQPQTGGMQQSSTGKQPQGGKQ